MASEPLTEGERYWAKLRSWKGIVSAPVVQAESPEQIAARHARVVAHEEKIILELAVAEHNQRVLTGPRATAPEPEEELVKKQRSVKDALADAVRRHNDEKKRRGFGAPAPQKGK